MDEGLREALSLALAAGAFILVAGGVGGWWLRAGYQRFKAPQEAAVRRELMVGRKSDQRQRERAREIVGEILLDMHLHPHIRLKMELELVPVLTERASGT